MKVAIVTGAAQGIGRRTAEVLAGAGYAVAALDLQSCAGTMGAVKAEGVDGVEVLGDICDEAVVERAVKIVMQRWGRVDVLVNNAGIRSYGAKETLLDGFARRVLTNSISGIFHCR